MRRGFTIIELILVIFIMVLLTLMTLPMFAQFVKSSRVEQTAHIVCTTICRARQEAMRLHKMVGVFFGDELAKNKVQPTPGILPQRGRIEIWSVKDNSYDGAIAGYINNAEACPPPYKSNGAAWWPYKDQDRCLTSEPITFPDGVRIIAGRIDLVDCYPKTAFGVDYPSFAGGPYGYYQASPDGEIKRHMIAVTKNGRMTYYHDTWSYWAVLVFDAETGENLLISCGNDLTIAKPHILPYHPNYIVAPSGTTFTVNKTLDVKTYLEQ